MSEISRSVQIVKQGKKIVDCTVRTIADVAWSYNDVAGPYADVAKLSWRTIGSWEVESFLDTWHVFDKLDGATWPRHGLADMEGSYDDVAEPYADVAKLSWRTVGSWKVESFFDTWHVFGKWDGATWPDMGCHVALFLVWSFKIIWSPWGLNPGPLAKVERLHRA
jgi:hypothetical protein